VTAKQGGDLYKHGIAFSATSIDDPVLISMDHPVVDGTTGIHRPKCSVGPHI